MYSKQETFNRVATHLLTQSKKCQTLGGSCRYRENDMSCAAGCLLTDRTYNKEFEGNTVAEILNDFRTDWFGHNAQLVCELQDVHDDFFVDEWKHALKQCADRHKLDSSILKQFRRRGDKYTRIEKPRWGTFRAKSKKARS